MYQPTVGEACTFIVLGEPGMSRSKALRLAEEEKVRVEKLHPSISIEMADPEQAANGNWKSAGRAVAKVA